VTASALCIGLAGVLIAAAATGPLPLPAAVIASVAVFTLVTLVGVGVAGRAAAPAAGAVPPGATTLARDRACEVTREQSMTVTWPTSASEEGR
jgi:hypothetical protein